jgi:hypothetical protein
MFEKSEGKLDEAGAVARVAAAAKDVQAAATALERHFGTVGNASRATLLLVHLASAMQELEAARDALDTLLAASYPSPGDDHPRG